MKSRELVICASEKVPTKGARMPATYLERGVLYAEHCDIMGLKARGGWGL